MMSFGTVGWQVLRVRGRFLGGGGRLFVNLSVCWRGNERGKVYARNADQLSNGNREPFTQQPGRKIHGMDGCNM
jgi:hypothetical protein